MGALSAGVLAMAIILLVIGLGWHVVWNGVEKGAITIKDAIFQMVSYFAPSDGSSDHSPTVHEKGLSKA